MKTPRERVLGNKMMNVDAPTPRQRLELYANAWREVQHLHTRRERRGRDVLYLEEKAGRLA